MKHNHYTVCFIDDDPAERNRFIKAFHEDFNVIAAGTYTEAIRQLRNARRRHPHLWVLDLYFPRADRSSSPQQLKEMSAKFDALDRATREFHQYLEGMGQSREGGLQLLATCRREHRAPVVMFTRKGTIDDAIACHSAGAVEILKKPMSPDLPPQEATCAEALDNALISAKAGLADRFAVQIAKSTNCSRYRRVYFAIAMFVVGLIVDHVLLGPPLDNAARWVVELCKSLG